jgi:hypothetical protein
MSDSLAEFSPPQDLAKPEPEPFEKPLCAMKWDNPPSGRYDQSIPERFHEFIRDPSVPPDIRALGLLTTELLITTSRQIEHANFGQALWGRGYRMSEPTLYAAKLYPDRLSLVLSAPEDYGNLSLDAISLPLDRLNSMTGDIALPLASERPELVDTLLSATATPEEKSQARVDLMRFLAQKKPDNVRGISDGGGLIGNTALGFTLDNQSSVFRLSAYEIPHTDPILGESVELSDALDVYYRVFSHLENHEFDEMTSHKIEQKLNSLPDWMKRIVLGRFGDAGSKSFRIMDFLGKFGYQGNETDKKFRKSMKMSLALCGATSEVRGRLLKTISSGCSPGEAGLDPADVDTYFRKEFAAVNYEELPDDFSISDIVLGKVPLQEVPISPKR